MVNTRNDACYLEHVQTSDEPVAVLELDLHRPDWRCNGFSLQNVGIVAMNPCEHWDVAKDLGGVFPVWQCAYALHCCMQEWILTHFIHDWMNMHGIQAHCCSECNLSSFLVHNVDA